MIEEIQDFGELCLSWPQGGYENNSAPLSLYLYQNPAQKGDRWKGIAQDVCQLYVECICRPCLWVVMTGAECRQLVVQVRSKQVDVRDVEGAEYLLHRGSMESPLCRNGLSLWQSIRNYIFVSLLGGLPEERISGQHTEGGGVSASQTIQVDTTVELSVFIRTKQPSTNSENSQEFQVVYVKETFRLRPYSWERYVVEVSFPTGLRGVCG